MAAPTHTTIPASEAAIGGIKLPNGMRGAILVFNRLPLCRFYTIKLKPGKIDGGDPIDQSTQLNAAFHTKAPRYLRDEGDTTVTAAYDPYYRQQIRDDLVNRPGSVTEYYPDGSYEDYFGWLKEADPSELAEGELPTISLTICKSNYDPVAKVEQGPVFVSVSGT